MRAGSQRHKVSIEACVEVQDNFGQAKETWVEVTKAYAGVYPVSGTERYLSMEKHATATHEIIIRYVASVTPKHRIVWGERVFDIISTLNLGERNKTLKIIAKENV